MKNVKLPTGQMNIRFITFKAGYAEGVRKPQKETKPVVKELVTKIRRNEKLVA